MKRKRGDNAPIAAARPERGRVWLGATPAIRTPNTHAILAQVLARVFTEIDVSASLIDGLTWYPINALPNVATFEMAHGMENKRWAYNDRCLDRVRREGGVVLGQHAGFHDLFAVVGAKDSPWTLVAGPFALRRPGASDVLSRWREVTGDHGHASDPEFLRYVSMTLGTATLDGSKLERFKEVLACFGRLLDARGDVGRLSAEVSNLRESLADVRFVERMWDAVREMIDERTAGSWVSTGRLRSLMHMGLERLPQHVLVGLLTGRERDADPVDDLFQRDAFQRACLEMGRKRGRTLCGRIADHGVILVVDESATGARLRAKLEELGERALELAKRFGLRLRIGVAADESGLLPARYQSALAAAEVALSRDQSIVHAKRGASPQRSPLGALRKNLTDAIAENPTLLSPRFDRYLEVLLVHCGHRLEATRAHLESAFDQIVEALRATGTLDEKNLNELRASLDRSATDAPTVRDLSAAYRAGIADVELT
ncbi:MAG TPA: hypothetical protein VGP93_03315, partial [Polyangiaceae bacterium]|nr:hypothetical protein [Polyangiaceae bacterium]